MSLARRHREHVLAQQSAGGSSFEEGGFTAAAVSGPAATAAAEMKLRLTHDLRRLKEIKSIAHKIDAKREMLPEYAAWVAGLLAANTPAPGDEVLPTIMVWLIDVADYDRALDLAEHVLAHDIKLPARYNRDAASLIVEEIADQALKAQGAGAEFPLAVLERVDTLTHGRDMHDPIQAKLSKAIGNELANAAEAINPATPAFAAPADRALSMLRHAQKLDDRVGVKGRINRLEKALAKAAAPAATNTAGTTAG